MELNALLAQPVALPSLPRAVALLMSELAQNEPSLRRLNQLFGTDPALAARLLELANSPTFQLPGQIAGIPRRWRCWAPHSCARWSRRRRWAPRRALCQG